MIIVRFKYFLFFITVLIYTSSFSQPRNDKFKYQPRGDREEGLTSLQEISGDNLSLISMRGLIPAIATDDEEKNIKVGFHLEKSEKLEITVREPGKYYKMVVSDKIFDSGYETYAWPSKIPAEMKIPISDLYALTRVKKPGRRIIIPCVLYQDTYNGEIQGYQLTFWARRVVDTELEIVNAATGEIVWNMSLPNLSAYKAYEIHWNGRDFNGFKIPSGNYILNIKASFHDMSGNPTLPVKFVYRFDHCWQFSLK